MSKEEKGVQEAYRNDQRYFIYEKLASCDPPFLLIFTRDKTIMHQMVNKRGTNVTLYIVFAWIVMLNLFLLLTTFGWITL